MGRALPAAVVHAQLFTRSCSRAVVHAQLFTPQGDGRKEGAPPLGAAAGTAGGARIGRALRRGRGDVTKNSPRISAKGVHKTN